MNTKFLIGMGLGLVIGMMVAKNNDQVLPSSLPPPNPKPSNGDPGAISHRNYLHGIPGGYSWQNCRNYGTMAKMSI